MMRRVLGSDVVFALGLLTLTYGAVAVFAALVWFGLRAVL